MKKSNFLQFWDVITPIFYYFIITSLTLIAVNFTLLQFPQETNTTLLRQLISSVVAGLFLTVLYKPEINWKKGHNGKSISAAILFGACFAIAYNTILGLLEIEKYSKSYDTVKQTFYMGNMVLEITALCIVIPFVEELLYRGIVYKRLKQWLGTNAAIVISALIFGLVHMNLVQFVYASVFGIFLAFLTENGGNFYLAALAHMAANLTSVLRAETNVFKFMAVGNLQTWIWTLLLLTAAFGSLYWFWKQANE